MEHFILSFLTTSLIMSLIVLCILIAGALVPGAPRMRYVAWVVVLIGFAIPFRPMIGGGLLTIGVPATINSDLSQSSDTTTMPSLTENILEDQNKGVAIQNSVSFVSITQSSAKTFTYLEIAAVIWLAVAAVIFVYHIWRYFRFVRTAKRWSIASKDKVVLDIFRDVQKEKGIRSNKIGLKICNFISTSVLVGFFFPVVLLPNNDYEAEELEFIFRHELIHYKRKDLYVKLLSVIAISLHWFNPLVYLVSRALQTDCEASCDEAVLQGSNADDRQFYAGLIMDMVSDANRKGTLLSTCFYGTKRGIKIRMETIINGADRRETFGVSTLIAGILTLTLLSGSVFGIYTPVVYADEPTIELTEAREGRLSATQAKYIALNTVGGGSLVELFYDTNLDIFRIEIIDNSIRYYLAIDSTTGNTLVYRTEEILGDAITWGQAVQVALSYLADSSLISGTMEMEGNQAIFTFIIECKGREYKILIDHSGGLISMNPR